MLETLPLDQGTPTQSNRNGEKDGSPRDGEASLGTGQTPSGSRQFPPGSSLTTPGPIPQDAPSFGPGQRASSSFNRRVYSTGVF
jgi:hypothetical protein